MNLIIVESPTKARTLTRFLKGAYQVEATLGHIRDLPKGELGVDLTHGFTPHYVTPRDKSARVKELKGLAGNAEAVILATDPDREGEAIAWHISEILSKKKDTQIHSKLTSEKRQKNAPDITVSEYPNISPFKRIVFHEITESAITEALRNPRTIDMQLVNAQQARRVLDRLVGYKLSPLLWQKLSRRWLSAGRVQSVVVRLIVEREREIEKFEKIEFWTIDGEFKQKESSGTVVAQLLSHEGIPYEQKLSFNLFDGVYTTTKTTIADKTSAERIISDLKPPFSVSAVDRKEIRRAPPPPFTTSTLQQEAGRRFYFSAKKTMQVAQRLYEEGFITYHRTDSVNISEKFITEAREYLASHYGSQYVSEPPRHYTTKSKVAQEAHEAIRPTNVDVHANDLLTHEGMNRDNVRLYELIWKRALSCQAAEAVFDSTTIQITSANVYVFQMQGSVIKFEGYLKIFGRENGEVIIPQVKVGEELLLSHVKPVQHFTQPPPRYSEATLVKALEEKDIGRPSTYAPIISTIIERNYVVKEEKKLIPTELGSAVTDFLVAYFPEILSLPFTAKMEGSLDEIANGKKEWVHVISEFYDSFAKTLEDTYKQAQKVKMSEEATGDLCPQCGSPLVIRIGRYGKFIACSTYPKCAYTKQLVEKTDLTCPKCGGTIVVKKSRRGKMFYGCSNYPKCTFAAWKKEDIK